MTTTHSTTLHGSIVTVVWKFPDFLLLLFSKSQFVTLSTADLSEDLQAFILQRVAAAGGEVV